jgi:hypothetical protein
VLAMASRPRTREDERRLSIRTLAIASLSSLVAALVTSQFWTAGTPITAAVTPVLVTLLSEILNRPTEKIVQRFTTDAPAVLPEAGGAGAPPRSPGRVPRRAPGEPGTGREPGPADRRPLEPEDELATGPVRVYGRRPPQRGRRIALGAVVVTGLLGFAVAATALTVPELITGKSIVKRDKKSTFFGGHHRKKKETRQETTPTTTPTQTEQQTTTQTTPQKTTTEKKQQTAPQQTTTSPAPPGEPAP